MQRRIVIVGIIALVGFIATACGGGGQQPTGQSPTPTNVINATEQEWAITVTPSSVSAGTYQFIIKNNGSINHNFVIQGLNARTDQDPPGGTHTLTVTLKPGTYTILCDIPGHQEAGMKTTLTVK